MTNPTESGQERECPRAKSDMTPCYLRDGGMVVVESQYRGRLCVGCDTPLSAIEGAPE